DTASAAPPSRAGYWSNSIRALTGGGLCGLSFSAVCPLPAAPLVADLALFRVWATLWPDGSIADAFVADGCGGGRLPVRPTGGFAAGGCGSGGLSAGLPGSGRCAGRLRLPGRSAGLSLRADHDDAARLAHAGGGVGRGQHHLGA